MIDVLNATISNKITKVVPSDALFEELGKNSYDYKDLLSELIDNSIAASIPGEILNVTITVNVDNNGTKHTFIINDNARGIPETNLGDASSPGMLQTQNSLNEHGLGMKQAIAALGKLKYLCTKTSNQKNANIIERLGFGDIETKEYEWDQEHGTEICVEKLKSIVEINPTSITRSLITYLGARYRRLLKADNPKMTLKIIIHNIDTGINDYESNVVAVNPIYYNPGTNKNEPVIINHELKGTGWKARLTFGYAPSNDYEYENLGIPKPTKFSPYHVSINNQGLDIIFHDRVILFHQLSELGIISVKHNNYNLVRGEIELLSGFQTAITKNMMINDDAFKDLIDQVSKILNGEAPGPKGIIKKYLEKISFPDEIPEALLRDRLVTWLKENPMMPKKNVTTEYSVDGIEGFIDIFADGEAWELKTDKVSALEVFQLFMYMDVKNIEKGYIVGKEITSGGQNAINHIKNKHNKTITFTPRSQLPINQPPTKEETDKYY